MKSKDVAEILVYIFLGYLIAMGANKGLVYGLGTDYPAVAVMSTSMEHRDPATYRDWFIERNYTEQDLEEWPFDDGIRKGDIVVVKGIKLENLKVGDVIVYKFPNKEPIIHRVVKIEDNSVYTKGDNNLKIDQDNNIAPLIKEENIQGKAVAHIPLFGWVKILFIKIVNLIK